MRKILNAFKFLMSIGVLALTLFLVSCDGDEVFSCSCEADAPYSAGGRCFQTESDCEDAEGSGNCKECD